MKVGTIISSAAHAGILGWGLLFADAAAPLFNVELSHPQIDVAFDDDKELATGDKDADISPKPAPKRTIIKPAEKPAENFGDTEIDAKSKTNVQKKPEPVEPTPAAKPKPELAEEKKETPVTTTQIASLNEPPVPVREDTSDAPPELADESEKFAKLPDNVPLPKSRPKPPKPKAAKTLERKKTDEIKKKTDKTVATNQEKSADDKIANLLNKQKPSAAGAKRSNKQASLGSQKPNAGKKLSRSEMDGLMDAIGQCSNGIAGREISEDLTIKVTMELARDGSITGDPVAEARGGTRQERRSFAREVLRYVKRCAPYDFLPKDKYDTWARVIPTFHPAEMFQ